MPLEGVRVIDCSTWHMGPAATRMLSDLGADVIKVEQLHTSDPCRGIKSNWGVPTALPGGRSWYVEATNRNKRAISLDLAKEKGKEILYRLVQKSDVFVHNFRDKAVAKLGLDYETLSQHNSCLIYATASGLGRKGPERNARILDMVAQARSGIMSTVTENGVPFMLISGFADELGGIMLAYAILAALFVRERSGIGQEIEVSLLGSLISLQITHLTARLLAGKEMVRHDRSEAPNPLTNNYRCSDDKWLNLGLYFSDTFWHDFCRVMGIKELEDDPKFTDAAGRQRNCKELISTLDSIFATKTRDEWLRTFQREGEFILGPIQTISEVISDPQVLENEYITTFDHPVLGPVKVVGIPIKFGRTIPKIRSEAPEYAQHTEEILSDLGYTTEQIVELKELDVI